MTPFWDPFVPFLWLPLNCTWLWDSSAEMNTAVAAAVHVSTWPPRAAATGAIDEKIIWLARRLPRLPFFLLLLRKGTKRSQNRTREEWKNNQLY